MNVSLLPSLNALLNGTAAVFLVLGFYHIRKGNRKAHKKSMLSALAFSALFLSSYLVYHASAGSVPYPYHDWTRPLYFIILIPHIVLAALMGPFIIAAVWYALRNNIVRHRRLVRWVFPVWLYVSVTGVAIYLMLYRL